ncbi:LAMI_0C08900g1_1 [Lachancea mirantina]|uniref:LAMI_0C08900g1_1 n=1 Tax=Lachancea mirantina TaxID=1230905 RepID=A0A1G4J4W7_9SACH|nr:LAMI_0C08900g1_1 [Lachancea mirantina]
MTHNLSSKCWSFRDVVTAAPLLKLDKLLQSKIPQINNRAAGKILLGDHFLYFNPASVSLSPDGYFSQITPQNLLNDDISFRRRLWAFGSLKSYEPLAWNRQYECFETIQYVKKIRGDYFVKMLRTISNVDTQNLVLTEERALIYTNSKPQLPKLNGTQPPNLNHQRCTFTFRDLDVVRYSALTFNPHRIHWDRDYCLNQEGYKNLIVQGPLLLQTLLRVLQLQMRFEICSVKYKNSNYVYVDQEVAVMVGEPDAQGQCGAILCDAQNPSVHFLNATILLR